MECPICRDLERAYDSGLGEYVEARASAFYQVSKKFAAVKHVDMERAWYALEEHRILCDFGVEEPKLTAELDTFTRLRQLVA